MPVDALEAKVHELPGHSGRSKLAAVVRLLELMVHDDNDEPSSA